MGSLAPNTMGRVTSLSDLPIRDDLRGREPYGAPQKHVRVELNVNENTHPIPEGVRQDILARISAALERANRYPDREFVELRDSLLWRRHFHQGRRCT